ncbi:MAG: hypothetical protein J6U16_08795 [Ruminococcus sp.]|nr:hypothetical protein [Ruminococcus sp.]
MRKPNKSEISADRETINSSQQFRPAIVRYIGLTNKDFTNGKEYEAFFEYWDDVRDNLHVRTYSMKK